MEFGKSHYFERFIGFVARIRKYRKVAQLDLIDPWAIAAAHFQNWSIPNHVNRHGLTIALEATNQIAPFVLETGTSAYGTDSSRLFDLFTRKNNGEFHSVDINPKASRSLRLQHGKQSHFHVADSVTFIEQELKKFTSHVDLCYLDSWDVDWSDPKSSAEHGLREFKAVFKFLKKNSVLIIDDTPNDIRSIPHEFQEVAKEHLMTFGFLPGKGSLVLDLLKSEKFGRVLYHDYNLVIKIL